MLVLECRRIVASLILIFKNLNQFVNGPEIVELFKLYAPRILVRRRKRLHIASYRSILGTFDPIKRLCSTVNSVSETVDFIRNLF